MECLKHREFFSYVSFTPLPLLKTKLPFWPHVYGPVDNPRLGFPAVGNIIILLFRTSRRKFKTLVHLDVIIANDTFVNGSRFRKNYFLCLNFEDQFYKLNPHYLLSSVPLDENDKFCEKNGLQHISIRMVFNKIQRAMIVDQTGFGMHMPSHERGGSGPKAYPRVLLLWITKVKS